MIRSRHSFYLFAALCCLVACAWLFAASGHASYLPEGVSSPCILMHTTGIACPSCGSTQSALLFMGGNPLAAMYANPLGIILAGGLLLVPLWILYDLLGRRDTLRRTFMRIERQVKKKGLAITLILVITANWIWNIWKTL